MNINLDFNKITVISTKPEDRGKFQFPTEGWFVGASNDNFGPDYFRAAYLYKPQFSHHSAQSWGGYTIKDELCWWTFNYTYSTICRDFLYLCTDKETAHILAKYLNELPSKNAKMIDTDIRHLQWKIEQIKQQCQRLESMREGLWKLTHVK